MADYKAQIDEATKAFRALLEEQICRAERMESDTAKKEYAPDSHTRIGLIDGDGIGPIIMREAERIARVLLRDELSRGGVELVRIEGLTLENRLQKGEAVPSEVLEKIRECDVLLKGPTATPKGGNMESANVALRRSLDLYANVRPVKVPEKNIDWVFYRENTEGEYVLGSRGIEIAGKLAMDFKVTTDAGTRRIAKAACEYAKNNGKTELSIVTKANIMKKTDGNFSAICHEVAAQYPSLHAEDWYIDIMSANLVNPNIRSRFQVFVLPNLYGDIITDEAAEIQGGVGTAGSANIGDRYAMFEAIHGTAPRMIEEGIGEYANPMSILTALAMLLRHIARPQLAEKLERAIREADREGSPVRVTGNRDGATAKEFADEVIRLLS